MPSAGAAKRPLADTVERIRRTAGRVMAPVRQAADDLQSGTQDLLGGVGAAGGDLLP